MCALANAAVELPEKDHPARRVIEEFKLLRDDDDHTLGGNVAMREHAELVDFEGVGGKDRCEVGGVAEVAPFLARQEGKGTRVIAALDGTEIAREHLSIGGRQRRDGRRRGDQSER